jgi:hypothetical protein
MNDSPFRRDSLAPPATVAEWYDDEGTTRDGPF